MDSELNVIFQDTEECGLFCYQILAKHSVYSAMTLWLCYKNSLYINITTINIHHHIPKYGKLEEKEKQNTYHSRISSLKEKKNEAAKKVSEWLIC